jgi:hypothetical protein
VARKETKMTGRIEFTNTVPGEAELTEQFLREHGAHDIVVGKDPEGNAHFTFSVAVDCPEDVANLVAIVLFYNDCKPEEADRLATEFNKAWQFPW